MGEWVLGVRRGRGRLAAECFVLDNDRFYQQVTSPHSHLLTLTHTPHFLSSSSPVFFLHHFHPPLDPRHASFPFLPPLRPFLSSIFPPSLPLSSLFTTNISSKHNNRGHQPVARRQLQECRAETSMTECVFVCVWWSPCCKSKQQSNKRTLSHQRKKLSLTLSRTKTGFRFWHAEQKAPLLNWESTLEDSHQFWIWLHFPHEHPLFFFSSLSKFCQSCTLLFI